MLATLPRDRLADNVSEYYLARLLRAVRQLYASPDPAMHRLAAELEGYVPECC